MLVSWLLHIQASLGLAELKPATRCRDPEPSTAQPQERNNSAAGLQGSGKLLPSKVQIPDYLSHGWSPPSAVALQGPG